jgi:hypothetical protein
MKTLLFTACLMALIEPVVASGSNSLSVEIDAAKLKYRVFLRLEKDTEYDSLALLPIARGLAPPGARVHIKDDLGQLVGCMNSERGYSSYDLYSGSPKPNSAFREAPQSGTVYSEWFDIADLVRGLDQCSKIAPEKWAKLMVTFSVRTHAKTEVNFQGQSAWLVLTPEDRRNLSGH